MITVKDLNIAIEGNLRLSADTMRENIKEHADKMTNESVNGLDLQYRVMLSPQGTQFFVMSFTFVTQFEKDMKKVIASIHKLFPKQNDEDSYNFIKVGGDPVLYKSE